MHIRMGSNKLHQIVLVSVSYFLFILSLLVIYLMAKLFITRYELFNPELVNWQKFHFSFIIKLF